MKSIQIVAFVCISILLHSCKFFKTDEEASSSSVLVEVYGNSLSTLELKNLLKASYTQSDSSEIAELYISHWIEEQILLHEAEEKLTDDLPSLEKKIEDYRNQLLVFELEKAYVSQRLDTAVADTSIRHYYEINREQFKQTETLVRFILFKVFKSENSRLAIQKLNQYTSDKSPLVEFCANYTETCHLADSSWMNLQQFSQFGPFNYTENSLPVEGVFTVSDKDYNYVVKVVELKKAGEVAPLETVRSLIRNIILNNRKKVMLKAYKTALKAKAKKENEIILHY